MVKGSSKKQTSLSHEKMHEHPEKSQPNSQHGTPCGAGSVQGRNVLEQAELSIDHAKSSKARSKNKNDADWYEPKPTAPDTQEGGPEGDGRGMDQYQGEGEELQLTLSPKKRPKKIGGCMLDQGSEPTGAEDENGDSFIEMDTSVMQDLFRKFLASLNQANQQTLKKQRIEAQRVAEEMGDSPREGSRGDNRISRSRPSIHGPPLWTSEIGTLVGQMPMSLPLPSLTKKIDLESHLKTMSDILEELGCMEDGDFKAGVRCRVRAMVIESFKGCPEVHDFARASDKEYMSWPQLQDTLLRQYRSRVYLKAEVDKALRSLVCKTPYSDFVNQVRGLYYLYRRFYEDKTEVRALVRKVIEVVPDDVARRLITNLTLINIDWEAAVPFEEFVGKLEQSLASNEAFTQIKGGLSRAQRVNFVQQKEKRSNGEWLEDWVQGFRGVLYCTGPGHRDEIMKAAESNKSIQCKHFKGNKGPYTLVGYSGEKPSFKCFNRPFVLRQAQGQSVRQSKN